jgi:hypothetical protein
MERDSSPTKEEVPPFPKMTLTAEFQKAWPLSATWFLVPSLLSPIRVRGTPIEKNRAPKLKQAGWPCAGFWRKSADCAFAQGHSTVEKIYRIAAACASWRNELKKH